MPRITLNEGEKFVIQVRKKRNRPSATFVILVERNYDRYTYKVTDVKYPSNISHQRNMRRQIIGWYWYPENPPSWWDSGSWHRLIVKAVKQRREAMERAVRLHPTA